MKFESKLSTVRIGGNKSNKQLSEKESNIKLYKSQEVIIKFYNDYLKIIHRATYDSKHGKDLKILTLKQMLQRIPITIAQVKAANTSEK